jgi:hypothetical protein
MAYVGNITIPTTVSHQGTTYKVVAIGNNAFNLCKMLTDVMLPDSISTIPVGVFER